MVATASTWTLDPEFPVSVVANRRSIVTAPGTGAIQRIDVQRSVGVDSGEPFTRVFTETYTMATKTERDAYLTIWAASGRGALAIAYTPPGGSAIPVRLLGVPTISRVSPTRYAFTVRLEEVTNA